MPSRVLIASVVLVFACIRATAAQQACPPLTDEPMAVEGGAPIVTLALKRVDGTTRSARFVFDSGGGGIILDEGLAKDLGLVPRGEPISEGGVQFIPTTPPIAQFGSLTVLLSSSKAFIHTGKSSFDTREQVEGLLPGKALEPYQVVLDYPRKRFAIATAGCLHHHGEQVPSPFVPSSGHPEVNVTINGVKERMLLDTGTRATLARRDFLEQLLAAHPNWPHSVGAAGTADMPLSDGHELLLRVPELVWGSFHIRNVLFVSRPDATYDPKRYQTPDPIMGALGGNVLKQFRMELDYPNGVTYLERTVDDAGDDMNSVGLVLDVDGSHHLIVRAISETATALTKQNVRADDQILKIDGKRKNVWTITEACDALAGVVGTKKRLVIRRNGKLLSTFVTVTTLL